ncbi:serine threonine protein phosphatase [Mycena olivaceomarginata]|nr:serine threonine protein phosphatase [Mycena olivaceomarginata]
MGSDLDDGGEPISEEQVKRLCLKAREILMEEANVQHIDFSCLRSGQICGDIHGQFFDLMELFSSVVSVRQQNYSLSWVRDFVDRGFYSVETFLLLLALKVRYPERMTLIRGRNHESAPDHACLRFLYDECQRKYGGKQRLALHWVLSLTAVFFGVHGGLSPNLHNIDQIRAIDRKQEVPHDGPMCDLLWSDPDDIQGWGLSPALAMEGYKLMFDRTIVTVWSAPNYCYRCGNVASILELDEHLGQEYKVFSHAPLDVRSVPAETAPADYFL